MTCYRVLQIDALERIIDAHVAAWPNDELAASAAAKFLDGYAAVEVWADRRCIARLASGGSEAAPE